MNGILAQEVFGDFNLTDDARQLLNLIHEHGASQTGELTEAVKTLSDREPVGPIDVAQGVRHEGFPNPSRVTSAQKLKGFLFRAAAKIGPAAVNLQRPT